MKNIGESIFLFGILLLAGLTDNYWLLFFSILPILTWTMHDDESNKKLFDAELAKVRAETRLLECKIEKINKGAK